MISPPLPWKAASINRILHLLQIFYHLPHWNHALRQSQSLCLLLPNNKSNGKRLTAGCTILKSNSFLPSVAFLDTVANLSGHDILRAFLWDLLLNQMNTLTWEKLTTLNTLKSNYEPDCPKLHHSVQMRSSSSTSDNHMTATASCEPRKLTHSESRGQQLRKLPSL